MCWKSYKTFDAVPKTVKDKKGKKVFKFAVLNKDSRVIRSYFMPKDTFCYKVGETTEEEIGKVEDYGCYNSKNYSISEGLYSYDKEKCYAKTTYTKNMAVYTFKGVMLGYYASHPRRCRHLVLLECTIPYGATYYENEYGEIVSNKLKVDKMIDLAWEKIA